MSSMLQIIFFLIYQNCLAYLTIYYVGKWDLVDITTTISNAPYVDAFIPCEALSVRGTIPAGPV